MDAMQDPRHAFVVRSLQAVGKEEWPAIAEATDVSYHTIIKIANETTLDPRINTVGPLFDYFMKHSAAPATVKQ